MFVICHGGVGAGGGHGGKRGGAAGGAGVVVGWGYSAGRGGGEWWRLVCLGDVGAEGLKGGGA